MPQAVGFLHQMGRVHRDIKSDNLLVNSRGECKMADFGFCVQLTQVIFVLSTVCTGHVCPEYRVNRSFLSLVRRPQVIFALGVVDYG